MMRFGLPLLARPARAAAPAGLLALLLALPAAADVDELMRDARGYLREGQINAAVIQLKNALQEAPNHAEARFMLGALYLRIGDVRGAEKELRRARELGWPRNQVLIPLAKIMFARGDFEALLSDVRVGADDEPALASDLTALRGMAEIALNRLDSARATLDRAVELNPDGIEARMGQVRLALAQRDLDAAESGLAAVIEVEPTRLEAWLAKARLHQFQGRQRDAVAAFDKTLELRPNSLDALIGRGASLLVLGEDDAALADVEEVLAEVPRQPQANYIKAQLLLKRADLDGAEAALSRALSADPDHLGALLLLGSVHYQKGNLAQAEASLERFIRARPEHLPAAKLLAAVRTRVGKSAESIELLERFLDLPAVAEDAQFYALLGNAYLQKGDFDSGSEYLGRATEIAPNVPQLLTRLALSLLAQGRTDEAIGELKSAVDLGQDLVRADVLLVLTHLRSRDFDAAIDAATTLVERRPDDPVAHNLLGAVYTAKGDRELARETFEKQLELSDNMPSARLNLARLAAEDGDIDTARGHYQALLDDDPTALRALRGMAALARQQNDVDGYRRWLEKAWQANPAAVDTGAELVRLYLRQGERLRALNLARDVHFRAPQNPAALDALGLALLANDDVASAVDNFEALTEARPRSIEAWLRLAEAQMRSGRRSSAETAVAKVLELAPDNIKALTMGGQLALIGGRADAALAAAERVQTLRPDLPAGAALRGDALLARGDVDGSIAAYRDAYAIRPMRTIARSLVTALVRRGDIAAAIEQLREWLRRAPTDSAAALRLASMLQHNGAAEDEVIAAYNAVIELNPDSFIALNNLAWIYSERADPRGVVFAERAAELAPNRPEVSDTLGWALVQTGEVDRGLRLLQQAAIQLPDAPDIRYHLGVAYDKAGRREDAVAELRRALDAGAAFNDEDKARALLERLR